MIASQSQAAKGRVRWQVVDAASGQVVREAKDWNRNIILNQGMDSVASRTWVNNMTYCAAGTGVTPTSDQSGVTTASQSGNVVDLVGGSFTFTSPTDVGKVIKWTSGDTAQISGVNSPTQAVVTNSATVGSNQFTVYRTNQVGLTTEVKRTGTYLTSAGACGTTIIGSTLQHRRTYDFTVEVGTVFYGEVGFSYNINSGNNLFSRILLDTPVQVDSGQQLRIVYELHVTVSPTTITARNAVISGWPVLPSTVTTGQENLQQISMSGVTAAGNETTLGVYSSANEPSVGNGYPYYVWLSTDANGLSAWGNPGTYNVGAAHAMSIAAYVAGSYQVDKSATFAVGEANQNNWRSMGYGYHIPGNGIFGGGNGCSAAFVFDQAQTKINTYTLTLTWRWTWSRDFS